MHKLTLKEALQVKELLDQYLTIKGDGLYGYLNGMSDEKIAKLIDPEATGASVRRVRIEFFGQLRNTSRENSREKRLKNVELAIIHIARELGFTPTQLSRLGIPFDQDGNQEETQT